MDQELKKYLLEQCRYWWLPEEIKASRRLTLTPNGEEMAKKIAAKEVKMEELYGFNDEKTNKLVKLGENDLKIAIANRLLRDSKDEIINNCPKCAKLTRTPRAKQCRHCRHDWH